MGMSVRMGAKSKLRPGVNGRPASARSKTGDPLCSAAMSAFQLIIRGSAAAVSMTKEQASKILGGCRAKARLARQGALQRAAGKEALAQHLEHRAKSAGPITAKARLAKAKEIRASRAAARAPAAAPVARPSAAPLFARTKGAILGGLARQRERIAQFRANVAKGDKSLAKYNAKAAAAEAKAVAKARFLANNQGMPRRDAVYHVTPKYKGGDLQTLSDRIKSGKIKDWQAYRDVAKRYDWPTPYRFHEMTPKDWREAMAANRDWPDYLKTEAKQVHFNATLREAVKFRNEFVPGGDIIAVPKKDLRLKVGSEYDHPVATESIEVSKVEVLRRARDRRKKAESASSAGKPTTGPAKQGSLKPLHEQAIAAASAVPASLRNGDKIFLHHAHEQYRKQGGRLSLEAFKQQLASSPEGRRHLARADLVQAFKPEDVRASNAVHDMGGGVKAEFNFIRVPKASLATIGGQKPSLREQAAAKDPAIAERNFQRRLKQGWGAGNESVGEERKRAANAARDIHRQAVAHIARWQQQGIPAGTPEMLAKARAAAEKALAGSQALGSLKWAKAKNYAALKATRIMQKRAARLTR